MRHDRQPANPKHERQFTARQALTTIGDEPSVEVGIDVEVEPTEALHRSIARKIGLIATIAAITLAVWFVVTSLWMVGAYL